MLFQDVSGNCFVLHLIRQVPYNKNHIKPAQQSRRNINLMRNWGVRIKPSKFGISRRQNRRLSAQSRLYICLAYSNTLLFHRLMHRASVLFIHLLYFIKTDFATPGSPTSKTCISPLVFPPSDLVFLMPPNNCSKTDSLIFSNP